MAVVVVVVTAVSQGKRAKPGPAKNVEYLVDRGGRAAQHRLCIERGGLGCKKGHTARQLGAMLIRWNGICFPVE
jgi:hypothetical protein